jgi:hypothetical protein
MMLLAHSETQLPSQELQNTYIQAKSFWKYGPAAWAGQFENNLKADGVTKLGSIPKERYTYTPSQGSVMQQYVSCRVFRFSAIPQIANLQCFLEIILQVLALSCGRQ